MSLTLHSVPLIFKFVLIYRERLQLWCEQGAALLNLQGALGLPCGGGRRGCSECWDCRVIRATPNYNQRVHKAWEEANQAQDCCAATLWRGNLANLHGHCHLPMGERGQQWEGLSASERPKLWQQGMVSKSARLVQQELNWWDEEAQDREAAVPCAQGLCLLMRHLLLRHWVVLRNTVLLQNPT